MAAGPSSVPVEIEVSGGSARLVVTGCLTEGNWRGLLPLLHRIGELAPDRPARVDLTRAYRVEPRAVELLRRTVERGALRPGITVDILARPAAHGYPGGGAPVRRAVPATGRWHAMTARQHAATARRQGVA